jgi:hypothetical protein
MNKEVARLWIDALRSGEYKHTSGRLVRGTDSLSYCCLGVLCELAVEKGVELTKTPYDDEGLGYRVSNFTYIGVLPPTVQTWAGCGDEPYFDTKGATYWNDYANLNFQQIADKIETEFLND